MARLGTALLLALVLGAGCGKSIGDACGTNVDCSITGERFCDTAPPGGYCTVEGCDVDTCPSESVCVRFFTPIMSESCQFDPGNARANCQVDERCVCDESPNGTCNDPVHAHCAPENSERRWCMKKCSHNGDCRNLYECRSTGTFGAEPVPSLENASGKQSTFCVSTGQPT